LEGGIYEDQMNLPQPQGTLESKKKIPSLLIKDDLELGCFQIHGVRWKARVAACVGGFWVV